MLGRQIKIASLVLLLTLVAAAETIPAGTHLTVRTNSTLNRRQPDQDRALMQIWCET